jgi:hypothetical protein
LLIAGSPLHHGRTDNQKEMAILLAEELLRQLRYDKGTADMKKSVHAFITSLDGTLENAGIL